MTDDALIEAMARAMQPYLVLSHWQDYLMQAKAALAVARPVIEEQERERCAAFVREWFGEGTYKGAGVALAAALKETGDE